MRVLPLLVAAMIGLVLLAGCGDQGQEPSTYRYSATPEEAIELFLTHVNAGEYTKAAALYHGALEVWERDPGLWKRTIEARTAGRTVVGSEPIFSRENKEAVTISRWLHFSDGSQRQVIFELVQRPAGWIIVSFQ